MDTAPLGYLAVSGSGTLAVNVSGVLEHPLDAKSDRNLNLDPGLFVEFFKSSPVQFLQYAWGRGRSHQGVAWLYVPKQTSAKMQGLL